MRVAIIKASHETLWYKKHIGDVFEVTDEAQTFYAVGDARIQKAHQDDDDSAGDLIIWKQDAQVITDEPPYEGEQTQLLESKPEISRRDFFAAHAMAALMTRTNEYNIEIAPAATAFNATVMADAMINALDIEKEPDGEETDHS